MSKILAIFRTPDMSTEQYDNIIKDLETAGKGKLKERPFHFMATDGNISAVVDVWESQDHLTKFFEELGPILAKHNVVAPQPEVYPVHNMIV